MARDEQDNEHQDVERPWTEQQWDDFMKEADLRAARYGELMETLIDHPDREELIDHEMGWDRRRDKGDQEWAREIEEAEAEVAAEMEAEKWAEEQEESGPREDPFAESDRELLALPAYTLSEALADRLNRIIEPLLRGHETMQETDEDLTQAYIQMRIAAAKISAGHTMGYEDEVIGGNLVNCKRALAAAEECGVALQSLQERRILSESTVTPLLAELAVAHKAIEDRISELRARMWWQ